MAYYNLGPPLVNVNVSAPPPVGYPQPGAPQNSVAAETGFLAWYVLYILSKHVSNN